MPDSSPPVTHDVVVVGGGPSGRIAALRLAQLGLSTVLIAPALERVDGRTTALWQKSISLLDEIGIWADLAGSTAPLKKMRMIDDTKRLIRAPEVVFDASELKLNEFGFNILNRDLNNALEEKCISQSNLDCIIGSAATVEYSETSVDVHVTSGNRARARLAVAADGRNSMLRQAAGIEVKTWSYPQEAVVLNVEHRLPHQGTSTEFHSRTGPFTLVPLPGRQSSIVCVETAQGARDLISMTSSELELELEKRAHSVLGPFTLASEGQSFPLSGLNAHKLTGRRLALVGETAHVFPPIGAQGLNLSLRDIDDLTSIIQRGLLRHNDPGDPAILASYEQTRMRDIKLRTNAVDALNKSLLTSFLPVQVARSIGMYMADRVGPFRRLLMREGMAPGVGFRIPG
ncbi:UbiH/UbiF family hydroxylase [Labrenzia sp. DG1229]|uniref:UbiH/UbiF family hydroxylase n=1 Tax=Labrenzia sp. DG1229 TaxID=681847 RepID=UPI00055A0925|nr:UbiH/UbiF family hydroxylase [Labrenzia sp. DG1229]